MFWDTFWLIVEIFFFFAYLVVLLQIVTDLFRDRTLGGFAKAVWIFFLIVVPFLTALVYLIARGGGMADRHRSASVAAEKHAEEYIRTVAGTSPTQQLTEAKQLLDSGVITAEEFETLKKSVLAG